MQLLGRFVILMGFLNVFYSFCNGNINDELLGIATMLVGLSALKDK